ncbi:MAG: hypothetical protein IT440_03485 [Phycisphaeraceae bacterium]|nr:hypothetical protein [Phycisphaeraceae bacterium]
MSMQRQQRPVERRFLRLFLMLLTLTLPASWSWAEEAEPAQIPADGATVTVTVRAPWPEGAKVRLEDVEVRLIAKRIAMQGDGPAEIPLKVTAVQPLKTTGGGGQRFKVTAELPPTVTKQDYRLVAYIDAGNSVTESADGTVDLDVTFGQVSLPGSIVAGGHGVARFTLMVSNKGDASLPRKQYVDLRVYARPAGAVDETKDITLVDEPNQSVGGMAPGETIKSVLVAEFPGPLEVGSYTLHAKIDGQSAVVETNKGNNEAMLPDTIAVTPASVDLLIDLATAELPKGVVAGIARSLKIPVKITNAGNMPFDADQQTDVHIIARPAMEAMNDKADLVLGKATAIPLTELSPGKSQVIEVAVTLPADLKVDSYILRAMVDPLRRIHEINRNNNTAMLLEPIQVMASVTDLTLTLESPQWPRRVIAGQTPAVLLPVKLRNSGSVTYPEGAAADIRVVLRPVEARDDKLDVKLRSIDAMPLGSLLPGKEQMLSLDTAIPQNLPVGRYRLMALVEAGKLKEADESNNTVTLEDEVAVEAPFVDLVASVVSLRPPHAIVGGTEFALPVPVQVTNAGNVPVPAGQMMDVQLSARLASKLDDNEHDVNLAVLKDQPVGGLAPGESTTLSGKAAFPAGMPAGEYVIVATLDPGNGVKEANEANNVALTPAAQAIRVDAPVYDLASDIVNLQSPAAVVAGTDTPLSVPVKVINQGNVATAKGQKIDLRVLLRPVDDVENLKKEIPLTSLAGQDISELPAGESKVFAVTATIGANVPAGKYRLAAWIDPAGAITDAKPANNRVAVSENQAVAVAAPFVDLVAELPDPTLPAGVIAGHNAVAKLVVKFTNLGNIPTPADRKVDIRLIARPADAKDDARDLLLATMAGVDVAAMAPASSRSAIGQVEFPATAAAGKYRLVAWVDPTNTLGDVDPKNNLVLTGETQVIAVAAPVIDLLAELTDPSLPAMVVSGFGPSAKLSVKVTNKGNIAVPADRKVDVKLIARPSEAGNDARDLTLATLTGVELSNLQPGLSQSAPAEVSFPIGTPAGKYRLAAMVDQANAIGDVNLQNNFALTTETQAVAVAAPVIDLLAELTDPSLPAMVVSGFGPSAKLSIKITNKGNIAVPAGKKIDVKWIARPVDAKNDARDLTLATLTGVDLSNLQPGLSQSAPAEVTFPAGAPAGKYRLAAMVDQANAAGDVNLQNNFTLTSETQVIAVAAPFVDLLAELTDPSLPAKAIAGFGPSAKLTVKIANLGNVPVPADRKIDVRIVARLADAKDAARDVVLTTIAGVDLSGLAPTASTIAAGEAAFPANIPAGKYRLAAIVDPANIAGDADPKNNVILTSETQAVDVAAPFVDLAAELTDPSLPVQVVAGYGPTAKLTIRIANQGNVAVPADRKVDVKWIARPVDAKDSSRDLTLAVIPAVDVSTLGVAASLMAQGEAAFPAGTPAGKYCLAAVVDPANSVGDANLNNNVAFTAESQAIDVALPFVDLAAQWSTLSLPARIIAGHSPSVKVMVRLINHGNIPVPDGRGVDIRVLARPVGAKDGARDVPLEALTGQSVAGLQPTMAVTAEGSVTIPAGTAAGTYQLVAQADPTHAMGEKDTANNVAVSDEKDAFTVVAPFIDLVAELPDPSLPTQVVAGFGPSAKIAVRVTNVGNVATADGRTVDIRLIARPVGAKDAAQDIVLTTLADQPIGNLTPGAAKSLDGVLNFPAGMNPGSYRIGAQVDPANVLADADLKNNFAILGENQTLAVAAPVIDLVAELSDSTLTPRVVAGHGATGQVTLKITQRGNVPIAADRKVDLKVFARPDDAQDASRDVALASLPAMDVSGLAPGQTKALTCDVSFPTTTPAGNYRVAAWVDPNRTLGEADDRNNLALTPAGQTVSVAAPFVDLMAMLMPSSLPAQVVAGHGPSTQLAVKIANLGNIAVPADRKADVKLIARPEGARDGSHDLVLATTAGADVSSLAPSAFVQVQGEAAFPLNAPAGKYRLGAMIDSSHAVDDLNRANNIAWTGETDLVAVATPFVDLTAELASSALPAQVVAGYNAPAKVIVKIANAGNIPVPADRRIDVRLIARPADATDEARDVVLATVSGLSVAGLAPATSLTAVSDVGIPQTIAAGTYRLVAWVDPAGVVGESDTKNNLALAPASQTTTVSAPFVDLVAQLADVPLPSQVVAGHANPVKIAVKLVNQGNIATMEGRKADIRLLARPADAKDASRDVVLTTLTGQDVGNLAPTAWRMVQGDVSFPDGMTAGAYRLGAWADPTNSLGDRDPSNNLALVDDKQAVAVAAPFVDLTAELTGATLPAQVVAGFGPGARLTVKIANRGNVPVPMGRKVDVKLIARPEIAADAARDIVLSTLTDQDLSQLFGAMSKSATGEATFSANTPPGKYRLAAVVDAANVLGDRDTANNLALTSEGQVVSVVAPYVDLIAELVNPELPVKVVAGVGPDAKLTVKITNLGNVPVDGGKAIDVKLIARPADVKDSSHDIALATLAGQNISNLATGASVTVTQTVLLPATLAAGKYRLGAVADPGGVVTDRARDNNTVLTGDVKAVLVERPFVDLVASIAMGSVSPELVAEVGPAVPVTVTVTNAGNAPLPAGQTVDIAILAQPVKGGADITLGHIVGADVSNLVPGVAKSFIGQAAFPASLAGNAYVLAADVKSTTDLAEPNRDNNRAAMPREMALSIVKPRYDLAGALDVVRASISPITGSETVGVFVKAINRGNVPLPTGRAIDIELVARPTGMGRDATRDIALAKLSDQPLGGLEPGQSRSFKASLTLRGDQMPTDDYYLFAKLDSSNVLAESNEEDNLISDPQHVVAVGQRFRIKEMPVPFDSDGPQRYEVNGIEIVVKNAAGLPPVDQFMQLKVELTKSYAGYVSPRAGEKIESPRLAELSAKGDIYLYRSAVRALCDRIRDHLEDSGQRRTVRPAPDQIGGNGEDLRTGGYKGLKIVVE